MKKTLYGLAALLALGAIGVYLAFNYIDVIVKVALEHLGPDVTGVTVKVGEVEISPRDIRHGRVTMTNSGLKGQGINFDLPDVELTDVGRRQNGVTASEAAAIVASTLQTRIAQKVLTNVELLRKGGVEGAVDALRGLLK